MSSISKKAKISEENKKIIESFTTTTQLYHSLDQYIREYKKRTGNEKERVAKEISELGNSFVNEMELKFQEAEIQKEREISEIFKKSGERFGNKRQLHSMSHEEVHSIYIKMTESRKSWFTKFMDFLMAW